MKTVVKRSPDFTIFVRSGIVEGVISHTEEPMAYCVVDYDILKAQGKNARSEFEREGVLAFLEDPCEVVPLSELPQHL